MLTFTIARQEGSDWRFPVAVLIKLLNGLITLEDCQEQLKNYNELWCEYGQPEYHVLKSDGTIATGLSERVARNYYRHDSSSLVLRGELMKWSAKT